MAYLFVLENLVAKPNVETILIEPFKSIWERDTTQNKEQAIVTFTFIELMTSKKKTNPYSGYNDEIRLEKLKELLYSDGWFYDSLLEQGLAKVVEFQKDASPTYSYYADTLETAEKTRTFLKNINLGDLNERTGLPIYKPKDITSAIIDTEKIILTLAALKSKVEQELFEQTKTRSNKSINHFEK